jgi:hypothetical protein
MLNFGYTQTTYLPAMFKRALRILSLLPESFLLLFSVLLLIFPQHLLHSKLFLRLPFFANVSHSLRVLTTVRWRSCPQSRCLKGSLNGCWLVRVVLSETTELHSCFQKLKLVLKTVKCGTDLSLWLTWCLLTCCIVLLSDRLL